MSKNFYYVYALKDPRSSPAKAFYIGKGTGNRAYDHLVTPDDTKKGARIKEINSFGEDTIVDYLISDITEIQALKLEAELISAFGTEETGGLLTNTVMPRGLGGTKSKSITVPLGARERAQIGLKLLKQSVYQLVEENSDGIQNSDAASLLGLRSDYQGKQKDYLSYSILVC